MKDCTWPSPSPPKYSHKNRSPIRKPAPNNVSTNRPEKAERPVDDEDAYDGDAMLRLMYEGMLFTSRDGRRSSFTRIGTET